MRVVVTGGAGYLGSSLVPRLLDRGHSVVVFDAFRFDSRSLESFANNPDLTPVRGDIRRLQEAPSLFNGADAVIHLAAVADEASCLLDPERAWDINVDSTRELASHALQCGVRRFIFASCPEKTPGILGETKRAAEDVLRAMRTERFEPTMVRLASLYGVSPRMRLDLPFNYHVAHACGVSISHIPSNDGPIQLIKVQDAAQAIADTIHSSPRPIVEVVDGEAALTHAELSRLASQFVVERPHQPGNVRESVMAELRGWFETPKRHETHTPYFVNSEAWLRLAQLSVEDGGEPAAPRFLPLARPVIGIEEETAVLDAMRSGWLTSGPHIGAFEKGLGATLCAEHVVAVTSCTAALHLCLIEAGVGPGDEVITSPITWASTGNTILNMGARVVFADIEPDTLNIDPGAVEVAITPRTKVIMPVHMAGQPCDLDAIRAIGKRHGIVIVEDAAHALGAAYHGTPIGADSDYACFSFYAIKNITTMEGGAIAVRDPERAKRLRFLAANGMTANAWERYGRSAAPAPPEVVEPGYKYLLGNISAAMGIEQLKKWPAFHRKREELAARYLERFPEIDEVYPLAVRDGVDHAWHLMIARFRLDHLTKNRDELVQALRRENIGTGVHFLGLHVHQYYREALGCRPEDLPNATTASYDAVSLPLYPGMETRHVDYVIDALKKVLSRARRLMVAT